ncbi:MAG: uroporphyrinogen decarboxylase family protein, partial [Phycisphaerae bacterium]|nr:uroporphyrinogen decarboxylase family protein [Phycisphaerae bacterium]
MFENRIGPNWQGLRDALTPGKKAGRVHFLELFRDGETDVALVKHFGLDPAINDKDIRKRGPARIALERFLGYDGFRCQPANWNYPRKGLSTADSVAGAQTRGTRGWVDEGLGMIQTMEDFEKYPWPDPAKLDYTDLEWYEKNLPDDMALYSLTAHQLEELCWIMGYEGLCMAMYDQPELVKAMVERIQTLETEFTRRIAQFSRVRFIWGSDDMGFKTGTMVQADFIRKNVLPCHRKCAEIAHAAGRQYLLHACGKLDEIMPDIINTVKVDAKHSFEDVIRPMPETKKLWGRKIGLIGGIDVDFLCRADEAGIRQRVR